MTNPPGGTRRLVLLVTSPRVAPGLLTWDAWVALHAGPVFTNDQDHPQLPALAAAGVVVESVDPELPPVGLARLLRSAAQDSGTATWLAGRSGDEAMARALADLAVQAADV
ncbi:MAG: nucleoside triphosphate pyrophosphohydrolase, partial [Frankiales bacterium]|nr:nucleoside triphosphate pyrophosphohydrolase [Frankiales bacterium]